MRTNEERMRMLHERAAQLQKQSEKKSVYKVGSICAVLLIALVGIIGGLQGHPTELTQNGFAASSLLSQSAGGYVLVASIAFMLGVVITIAIKKTMEKNSNEYIKPYVGDQTDKSVN